MATAASRTTPTSRTKKPAYSFSIKQAMKERSETEPEIAPFVTETLTGDSVTFRNPKEIGWQESASINLREPFLAIRTMLEDGEYDKFIDQGDFPREILQDLIKEWMDHYGLVPPGN